MINQKFVQETDKLIALFKERGIKVHNGNMIVAKVKVDEVTKGGLFKASSVIDREEYQQGFARILALADDKLDYKVGDYIIFSHEARYLPYRSAVEEFLGTEVEEKFIFAVQDNEPIMSRGEM